MSEMLSNLNELFEVIGPELKKSPEVHTLDPIADLNAKSTLRIKYRRKPKLNASSAFMVISKRDKNWIGLLLQDLKKMVYGYQADATIIYGTASARSTIRGTQTWFEFITELYNDKISLGDDISEAQAKKLAALIEALSAVQGKLAGCGSLEFVDEQGNILS